MPGEATRHADGALAQAPVDRPTKRRRLPTVRRQALLAAAERLFREQGIAATSIEEIAVAAGVAKGTFYLYFASKQDLIAATREFFATSLVDRIAERVARSAPDDWPDKLAAWVEAAVNASLDNVEVHDALFHGGRIHPHRYTAEHENPAIAHLATLLAGGNDAGAWWIDDPRMTAVFLFHAFHGAVDYAIATEPVVDRSRLIRLLQRFFASAVAQR